MLSLSFLSAVARCMLWAGISGDKDQDGPAEVLATFRTRFEEIVTSQKNIDGATHSASGDVLALAWGDSEAVADRVRECQDAKDAAQWGV